MDFQGITAAGGIQYSGDEVRRKTLKPLICRLTLEGIAYPARSVKTGGVDPAEETLKEPSRKNCEVLFQEGHGVERLEGDFLGIPVLRSHARGVKVARVPELSKPPGRLQSHRRVFPATFQNASDGAELHGIPLQTATRCCFPAGHLCILSP